VIEAVLSVECSPALELSPLPGRLVDQCFRTLAAGSGIPATGAGGSTVASGSSMQL